MTRKSEFFKSCFLGVAFAALELGAATAKSPPPRNLYAFGDSNSSIGNDGWTWTPNSCVFSSQCINNAGWEFRFSNGPTWVERLGYQLGLAPDLQQVQAPYGGYTSPNRGYSFAHSKAVIGNQGETGINSSGIEGNYARLNAVKQVDFFSQSVKSGAIRTRSNDLFSFWFNQEGYNPYDSAATGGANGVLALDRLRAVASANSNILVLGSILPTQGSFFGPIASISPGNPFDSSSISINNTLSAYAQTSSATSKRAKTTYVDVAALVRDIQNRPEAYGIRVAQTKLESVLTEVIPGVFIPLTKVVPGTCLAAGFSASTCPNDYLFFGNGTLSSRGHDILAYYVASTLGGVYAWDQYRAVGSGSGAPALATAKAGPSSATSAGFAAGVLGLNTVNSANGIRSFAFGLDENSQATRSGQSKTGSLQLIGSTMQLTPTLQLGTASFSESAAYQDLDANAFGFGASGYVSLDLGRNFDLNVTASSQSRTLNTSRPILFDYVAGVAKAQTKVSLDSVQASLSKMFDVKGLKIGPVVAVASVNERWGETRETGVPEWLALNRSPASTKSYATNLGLVVNWTGVDRNGGEWSLSANAGRIDGDDWLPTAMLAPSVTLADALEQEKGSASFVTFSADRELENGWSFGLEAGLAQTSQRQVEAVRARAAIKF
jgi:hypothetical protein